MNGPGSVPSAAVHSVPVSAPAGSIVVNSGITLAPAATSQPQQTVTPSAVASVSLPARTTLSQPSTSSLIQGPVTLNVSNFNMKTRISQAYFLGDYVKLVASEALSPFVKSLCNLSSCCHVFLTKT